MFVRTLKIDGYLFNLKIVHLRMFVGTLQPMGLEPKMFCNLFHRTLSGAAAQWFLSLEDSKTRNWEDIMDAFVAQYNYNTQLDVTLMGFGDHSQEFWGNLC